jgi:transcriptional regulator with XRE-family HTH domain
MDAQDRSLGQRMAAEIRAEMARQGRSIRGLAEQIDESHVTVGRWVKGRSPLKLDELDSVCRALGLTIADLLAAVDRNGGYVPAPVTMAVDTEKASRGDIHRLADALAA